MSESEHEVTPEQVAALARERAIRSGARSTARYLTPAQRALRDTAIVVSTNAGMTARELAREFGISSRTVERVLEAHRRMRSPLEQAPMEVIEDLLRAYSSQVERLTRLAFDLVERAPAAAVAAIRAESEITDKRVRLLADLGKLPSNLALFREMAELDRIGEIVIDRVAQVARGEVPAEDVLRLVEHDLRAQFGVPAPDDDA